MSEALDFIHDELIYLWGQLWDAYQSFLGTTWRGEYRKPWHAGGDQWSGRCDGLGKRITAATALVGPVSCHDISMTALVDGWFVWVNERLGIENPDLPDEELLERCRQYVADQQAMT